MEIEGRNGWETMHYKYSHAYVSGAPMFDRSVRVSIQGYCYGVGFVDFGVRSGLCLDSMVDLMQGGRQLCGFTLS